MQKCWSSSLYAEGLEGREVILICDGNGFLYKSSDGKGTEVNDLHDLDSTQEETDTRVILYLLYAKKKGFRTVKIRMSDSDIYFIILHYMNLFDVYTITVLYDTGTGNKRRVINISELSKESRLYSRLSNSFAQPTRLLWL